MKKTILSAVAALLIAGSMAEVTPAFARHQAPAASSRTFRNALERLPVSRLLRKASLRSSYKEGRR
jgi:hypothetical protein